MHIEWKAAGSVDAITVAAEHQWFVRTATASGDAVVAQASF